MKKILSFFVIVFILLQNISFAEFNIETKLSVQKQESYKKQVDTVYKGFENKISKFNEEKQISNIEKVVWKIEIILKNKLSDKNNFVLSYLNYLLKEKLDFLKNNDESINLWKLLQIEDEKIIKTENKTTIIEEKKTPKIESEIKTCYGDNWIWEEKITLIDWVKQTSPWCKFIKCNDWYDNINWACIKKQVQKTCSQNEHIENNSCVLNFRSCNVDNWVWEQQYLWNFWTACLVKSCNEWFENNNWVCIKKCDVWYKNVNNSCISICWSNQHYENNECVSNMKQCQIDWWRWEQTWSENNWLECKITTCNYWYILNWNSCIYTLPYLKSFEDNHWNSFIKEWNTKLSNIINKEGFSFSTLGNVKKNENIDISIWVVSPKWNTLLCSSTVKFYSSYPGWDFKENKELWECWELYKKSINTGTFAKKILISISVKEWKLTNMDQLYQTNLTSTDSITLSYDIIE